VGDLFQLTLFRHSLAYPFETPNKHDKEKNKKRQRLQKQKLIRPNCQTITDDKEEVLFNFTETKIVAFALVYLYQSINPSPHQSQILLQ